MRLCALLPPIVAAVCRITPNAMPCPALPQILDVLFSVLGMASVIAYHAPVHR